jgi:hypothetical protein
MTGIVCCAEQGKVVCTPDYCTFCGIFSDATIVQNGFPQTVADAPAAAKRDTLSEKTSLNSLSGEAQGESRSKFSKI